MTKGDRNRSRRFTTPPPPSLPEAAPVCACPSAVGRVMGGAFGVPRVPALYAHLLDPCLMGWGRGGASREGEGGLGGNFRAAREQLRGTVNVGGGAVTGVWSCGWGALADQNVSPPSKDQRCTPLCSWNPRPVRTRLDVSAVGGWASVPRRPSGARSRVCRRGVGRTLTPSLVCTRGSTHQHTS